MSGPKRFVYVIKHPSTPPQFYVGLSSDVDARLVAHNLGACGHTSPRRPWELHVVIAFTDEARAVRFERYLQSGSARAFAKRHFEA
jgi:predicted GIY-YIG superfamily endonuclease